MVTGHRVLRVTHASYTTAYENPEDDYAEFIHEVAVTLCEEFDDEEEEIGRHLVELTGLIVRGGRRDDGISVVDMADAHSRQAEGTASFLDNVDIDDFFSQFDVVADSANAFLIEGLKWAKDVTVAEVRQFVRRAADQFDIDLVLIDRDASFARVFEGFFEMFGPDSPFLICSQAHRWPEAASEILASTSAGGDA